MSLQADELLSRLVGDWVDAARRRGLAVVVGILVLTALLGGYAALQLGVNSDNLSFIDPDLPFMRNQREFAELFPVLDNALLVVVDAETPELARQSAEALKRRLAQVTDLFEDVYIPGGSRFFEQHGLLYRQPQELDEFAVGMARMQPLIAELERDGSIANLARLVRLGLAAVQARGEDGAEWAEVLQRIGRATVVVFQEFPLAISWEEVMLRGSAIEVSKRRVIVLHPRLDFGNLLAAGSSMRAVRQAARELGLDPERGVRVRITGNPALNYEEMVGLLWDIGAAGLFCFLLVAFLVYLALRAVRLVVAVIATLLVGLIWTAAFAAASVGDLNLGSIAFAILFIGLGVDFGIHLGMRYADLFARGHGHEVALRESAQGVGASLVLCTVTTAIAFYVFVPTEFRGVAELGLISGSGMVIILFLTLTFLPALLSTWLRLDPTEPPPRAGLRFRHHWWGIFQRHPRAVRWGAALTGAGGLALLPLAYFEPNVVNMRDPSTESVQAFNDLLDQQGVLSPWFVNAVESDLERAEALAARLRELPEVDLTLTVADFVPSDQEEKLEILADLSMMLDTPARKPPREPLSTQEQVEALRGLHDFLDADWIRGVDTPLAASMRLLRSQLAVFLERIESNGEQEEAIATLERVLLSSLPRQFARLRKAIDTPAIEMRDLPATLQRRMLAPDGRARVQVFPAGDLQERGALAHFTDSVARIAPDAVGVPVNLVAFGRVTVASFQQALISAVLLIGLLLFALWRRAFEVVLVLAPLLLGAVLTGSSVVLLGVVFSFFNVIVIPLLFGIGVDSGIHLVHQAFHVPGRAGRREDDLLGTTTARAVFYSAVTTTASFGTLAFSDHRGMRSLGILLTVGMVITVVCNLVVLPALIELRAKRNPGESRPPP